MSKCKHGVELSTTCWKCAAEAQKSVWTISIPDLCEPETSVSMGDLRKAMSEKDKTVISVIEVNSVAKRWVVHTLNLIDAEIRRQLVSLGWTPPREPGDESSQEQQARAWEAVARELLDSNPRTFLKEGSGTECAVAEIKSLRAYKDALDEMLIVDHLGTVDSFESPEAALQALVAHHMEAACDTNIGPVVVTLPRGVKLELVREE